MMLLKSLTVDQHAAGQSRGTTKDRHVCCQELYLRIIRHSSIGLCEGTAFRKYSIYVMGRWIATKHLYFKLVTEQINHVVKQADVVLMNFSILDMVQHGLLCHERCGLYQQHCIHAGTAAMAYPPTLKERILNPIEGGSIKVIHVKI